jgi:hypothetical protein
VNAVMSCSVSSEGGSTWASAVTMPWRQLERLRSSFVVSLVAYGCLQAATAVITAAL